MPEREAAKQHEAETPGRFHEDARELVVQALRDYGAQLMELALALARNRRHPLVLPKDVRDARLLHTRKARSLKSLLIQIPSAALVGAFLQGFAVEMAAAQPDPRKILLYVVIGLVGALGVFFTLLRG